MQAEGGIAREAGLTRTFNKVKVGAAFWPLPPHPMNWSEVWERERGVLFYIAARTPEVIYTRHCTCASKGVLNDQKELVYERAFTRLRCM
jgi:hypothetical protein